MMSFVRDYVKYRSERDSKFKRAWEEGKLEREIAAQLIELRLKLGMTQSQFAELIGVKQSFLSRLENGEQKHVRFSYESKAMGNNLAFQIEHFYKKLCPNNI